jgi:nucleotide-binding universal stress UspA family protein
MRIVTAWHTPFAALATSASRPPADASLEETLRRTAERIADRAAKHVREVDGDVPVQTRVVEGHAAEVLIDTARGADLLVLGAPGRSSVWGLSSVVVQCAIHAPTATAIGR